MGYLGEWARRFGYLLRRRAREEELRREMEAHRASMDDPRRFGNTLRLRDEARDTWGWRWLDDLNGDVRLAVYALRRTPGFTLTAVLTLALGIGANTGMGALINSVLLRPLFGQPEALVGAYGRDEGSSAWYGLSYPNYVDLREGTTDVFSRLAAVSTVFVGIDADAGARRTLAACVTSDYFQLFHEPVSLGRSFMAAEARPGAAAHVVVISHAFWQQRGSKSDVLGRTLRVNGQELTIIGVAAQGFSGATVPGPELWLPLGLQPALNASDRAREDVFSRRDTRQFGVLGLLRTGTSMETATAAVSAASRRLQDAFPAVNGARTIELSTPSGLLFMPGPANETLAATLTMLLMILPAIVLLVACLNLADLLLARSQARRQELAIRASLGGSRGRIARQILTEGLLLALVGGAVGLACSVWAAHVLLSSLQALLPAAMSMPEVSVDWRVLSATVGISVLASALFCALPAWSLAGGAIVTDLKRLGNGAPDRPGGFRPSRLLTVGQVALSLLLLASGGLFLKSALAATSVDPGFDLENGLLVNVDPGLAGLGEPQGRQLSLTLLDRVQGLPGVAAATLGSGLPFSSFAESRDVVPAEATESVPIDAVFTVTGRGYARTLGLRMLAGRDFTDAEIASDTSERVAILDEALAHRLWPTERPLGRLVRFVDADEQPGVSAPLRVIGIVPAVAHSTDAPQPFPHIYVPFGQHYRSEMALLVRVARGQDQQAALATISRVVHDADTRLPVLGIETWRDHIDAGADMWLRRTAARVCLVFGGIAVVLAVVGVYGVKSYVVSRRTREFGVRLAVGAPPRVLLRQVLGEGGRLTLLGIALGLLMAAGATRILRNMLYGLNGLEPLVLAIPALILVTASLAASVVPAIRASRVDPTTALRAE